jgi:4a-hydroxytetrahydrobiopterin dehydratase
LPGKKGCPHNPKGTVVFASLMPEAIPSGWKAKSGKLEAAYEFKDFKRAMVFLNEVAFAAEAQEHHPDFTVHWNRVDFQVWSHDAGKVTERDHKLVKKIAAIAKRHRAKTP